jgi:hypothetical protein
LAAYAEHLEDVRELLSSVRHVSDLARDLAGTGPLAADDGVAAGHREAHAAFAKAYGDATVEGIGDEDDARDLLRDAVNLVLRMAETYVARGGGDRILIGRVIDVQGEFKPGFGRHHGLGVGDRVEERIGGIALRGEVVELPATDNNRAVVRGDDGETFEATCDCCRQIPTFRQRAAAPAPSPR